MMTRLEAVSPPTGEEDAEYVEGLREAVSAALDLGLAALADGEERSGSLPGAVVAQIRHAVRNRVGLASVLRRYFAGYAVLCDFLMEEARYGELVVEDATLHRAQRELAILFDRLVSAVSTEYSRAVSLARRLPAHRLAERINGLLAGEPLDLDGIPYDFALWHVAAVGADSAEATCRSLARTLDSTLLLVGAGEGRIWAWFGCRRRPEPAALVQALERPAAGPLAIGEPAYGMCGWRSSHREAQAALAVALRQPDAVARYADVALLATILRDDGLAGFLTRTYLAPLASERDGGEAARRTLAAYFAAERNASSAAAALGVSRRTVANRLRAVEEKIGRPLSAVVGQLEAALSLHEVVEAPTAHFGNAEQADFPNRN